MQLGKIAELVAHEKHVRIGRSNTFITHYIKEVDRKKKCCTFVKNGEIIETPMSLQYIQKLSDEMEERI